MSGRLVTASQRSQFEDFVRALFQSGPLEVALRHLGELDVPFPYRTRMKVVYSRSSAESVLEVAKSPFQIQRLDGAIPSYLLRTDGSGRKADRRHAQFAVFPTAQPHVSVVLSIATSHQWQEIHRFLRSRYPRLVSIYLSQKELVAAVNSVAAVDSDITVRVKEISAKESLGRATTKKIKSVREWTEETLDETLSQTAERQQHIVALTLAFFRKIGERISVEPHLMCRVTREAQVDISGRFDWAWSTVMPYLSRVAGEKLSFYSDREIKKRDSGGRRPAPLAIRFRSPVFDEVSAVRQLVGVLSKYPHGMYAVRHGNPYAFVNLADTIDGSSFEIWALTATELALVPQLQASEAAFSRLVGFIFENFREGDVVEYS
jgi:hypothetical protein